jgi:hypothetical protein
MTGGNIEQFLKQFDLRETVEIGRGGAGVAYIDKTQPDSVFKMSVKNETCRNWGKESIIYDRLNTYINVDTVLCKLLKKKDYYQRDSNLCCMELTRAFNPLGNELAYTIHPQFQYKSLDYKIKGRGLFLGIDQLIEKNIFTDDNIKQYIRDLGIVMARLHYKIKNDGFDLELFISKTDDKIIIYIGDFDLSEFYEVADAEIIKRLSWSLEAVPYFPIDGELFTIFKEHYVTEAGKYGEKDIAEEVLRRYLE